MSLYKDESVTFSLYINFFLKGFIFLFEVNKISIQLFRYNSDQV